MTYKVMIVEVNNIVFSYTLKIFLRIQSNNKSFHLFQNSRLRMYSQQTLIIADVINITQKIAKLSKPLDCPLPQSCYA